jgi:hypothetical protein
MRLCLEWPAKGDTKCQKDSARSGVISSVSTLRLDIGEGPNELADRIGYCAEQKKWKKLKQKCEAFFNEAMHPGAGNRTHATFEECKAFFNSVGSKFFGEPLGSHLQRSSFERFDFDDSGGLSYFQCFRMMRIS